MKQILFYGYIYDERVKEFLENLHEAEVNGEDIHIKANSSGGGVYSGWGMIADYAMFPNKKKVTVHGNASSMMSVFLLYSDETEAIEQSKFILHRASSYREDESNYHMLEDTNKDIRKAMEEKLDIEKFEKIAGVSLDRFFDVKQPVVDVHLNAKQAKSIKLIKKVLPLSSKDAKAINDQMIAACAGQGVTMLKVDKPKAETENTKTMNLSDLKKDHPSILQAAIAEATPEISKKAIESERDRVAAWAAWNEVDPKAVIEGINSGEAITTAKVQEFTVKGLKNGFVANSGSQGNPPKTEEDDLGDASDDPEAKEEEKFESDVREILGVSKSQ